MKEKLFNKTWKKCVWAFLIFFILIGVGGTLSINYLHDVVTNNHVHSDVIIVKDKIYGDNPYTDYYIVIGSNNKTYSIVDHDDDYGQKMFDMLEIGKKYKVIIREPELTDINQFTHILQVYNDTGTT